MVTISQKLKWWLPVSVIFSTLTATPCLARSVKSLTIEASGQHQDDNDPTVPERCHGFKPTQREIRKYFNYAYPVEHYVFSHSRYSPCYAKGSIRFSDGEFGTWRVSSSGAAVLIFNRGDGVTMFYGHNSWEDPFEGMYDYKDD